MHSLLPIKSFKILHALFGHGVALPFSTTDVSRGHPRSLIFYSQPRPRFVRTHPP